MKIIPFKPEHLQFLVPREFEVREMQYVDAEGLAREYLRRGAAYSGVKEGRLAVCAGVFPIWRGVGEVWMVTTDLVRRYPLAFHKTVKRMLELLQRSMGLWRLQTAVHREHCVSRKWIGRLGFNEEEEMPAYGPDGATYVRYARVCCLL